MKELGGGSGNRERIIHYRIERYVHEVLIQRRVPNEWSVACRTSQSVDEGDHSFPPNERNAPSIPLIRAIKRLGSWVPLTAIVIKA